MPKSKLNLAVTIVLAFCAAGIVARASTSVNFMPPPPGSTVESSGVAFNGQRAKDAWRAIIDRELVGSGGGRNFYQWYLSIYELRRGAYRLRYQSPRNGGPLSRVEQAVGAKMWFPIQEAHIVGTAQLMGRGAQQVVVQSHEMAADCGSAKVTVLANAPGGTVAPSVTVGNPCELSAKIRGDGAAIELTGPFYGPKAPLCCPTKPNATAVLRYVDGKWSESPDYFKIE
jgi:hypothetical protein